MSSDSTFENPAGSGGYFQNRRITPDFYQDFSLPKYLLDNLPQDPASRILDLGCGFGQIMSALAKLGYKQVEGVDIDEAALAFCRAHGLNVVKINDIVEYATSFNQSKYDFIIMSHVLEHIDKDNIIPTLLAIRQNLLADRGQMLIMVPNAQSNTGCYWAFEDFTHTTLFTAGSLYYVLKAAGFQTITFLDPYCLEDLSPLKKLTKKSLLKIYILKNNFWNRVTSSYFHKPSPQIFSFEIKVLAR
jgi:cyclopropane fatty-acyl-phospholipid synthase-like methyltransferase